MKLLVFDIRTTPRPEVYDRILAGFDPKSDPPRNLKRPDTIEAWRRNHWPDEAAKRAASSPVLGQVVGVGVLVHTAVDEPTEYHARVWGPDDDPAGAEREAIGLFVDRFRHNARGPALREAVVTGFNSKSFQAPYLETRARILGLDFPWLDRERHTRPGEGNHIDLRQYVSDASLHRVSRYLGTKRANGSDCDAATTAALWADGMTGVIEDQLRDDVQATYEVALACGLG